MTPEYLIAREALAFRIVSLGYRSVILLSHAELQEGQVGYSVDPQGRALTGDKPGDWRESWLVIGYEDQCGDPIFIDVVAPKFPVYTAPQGMGDWLPELVATSFANFVRALTLIKNLSVGRETPVERQANPISNNEGRTILEAISSENPGAPLEFWETWLNDARQ